MNRKRNERVNKCWLLGSERDRKRDSDKNENDDVVMKTLKEEETKLIE